MKVAKYTKLIRQRGSGVWINTTADGVYLATTASIYKAEGLPFVSEKEQIAAILDLDQKQQAKVVLTERGERTKADIMGYDLSDGDAPGDISADRMKVSAIIDGKLYAALSCRDGEVLFFDEMLLAPLADILKDELAYISYTIRRHSANGQPYIVIKNGFITIAMILPMKVLSDEYISELQDFQLMCIDQLNRENARTRAKEAASEAENGRQSDISDFADKAGEQETEAEERVDDWSFDEDNHEDGADDA